MAYHSWETVKQLHKANLKQVGGYESITPIIPLRSYNNSYKTTILWTFERV